MLLFVSQNAAYKGIYDSSINYKQGDIVLDQDASYICIHDNIGILTNKDMYWAVLNSESSIIDDSNLGSTTTTLSASKITGIDNNLQTALDGKAPINHTHLFTNISDVDVTTIPPSNGDVLTFEEGKWVPKASSSNETLLILEDWTLDGGETVDLIDDVPPVDVFEVNITYLDKTSFTLNWTESSSSDTKDYTIYNGSTLVTSVPATISKLQPLTYQVTGLNPGTTYSYTIKARDYSNNEAAGVSISVKTYGTYSISMNGITDFFKLPSLNFDTVELTCQANPGPTGVWYTYVDARPGVSTSHFSINDNGNVQFGPVWTKILINGITPIDINDVKNNKITLTLGLSSIATDDINIFSDYQNKSNMMGNIYSVKVINSGNVVAYYNFTEQFTGSSVQDISGNGHTALLNGGTWVSG